MATAAHVVVVGAGIVGAAVAEALALDGLRVTVVDRHPPGGGATAAGMGHVVVMDDSQPQIALTSYSQQLWDQRGPSLPAAGERIVCGTLWVAADDEEMTEVFRKRDFYRDRGIAAEALTGSALYKAEPMLRAGLAGGLRVPGDSVVYPPPIAAAMLDTVRQHGGEVLIGCGAKSMTGNQVRLEDDRVIYCDYAVNAAGSAAGLLTPGFEIRPRKGHLVITDRYPGFVRHQLVELGYLKSAHSSTGSSVAFNVQPRPTGQLLIGSSRQFGDTSREIDHEILSRMLRRAIEYMPAIASLSTLRVWTGFRAATPDKLPLIGPHPEDPHLLLATGHEGLGITTSLGTARLIADHLAGRTPAIPPEPYLPWRFQKTPADDLHREAGFQPIHST
jgi:glycine/D-amino acid oxidase-like deaminating enzyme